MALLACWLVSPCPSLAAITSYQRSRYDRRVNVFSPDGELLQASYADAAADRGDLVLAAVTKDGSVIICKQTPKNNKLLVPKSKSWPGDNKIRSVNDLAFAIFSGLLGDSLSLLSKTQNFAIRLKATIGSEASITTIATKVSELQHSSTLQGGERPFGVNTILLGHDSEARSSSNRNSSSSMGVHKEREEKRNTRSNKPKIFCINASGNVYQCSACAIGKGSSLALQELEESYSEEMGPEEVVTILKTIASKCLSRFGDVVDSSSGSDGITQGSQGAEEPSYSFDVHILSANAPGDLRPF